MEGRKFWVTDAHGSHFDFEAFYASLSDEPMTAKEKELLDEAWNKDFDEFQPYIEQCTTKEGYEKMHSRECWQYHREEFRAGLG